MKKLIIILLVATALSGCKIGGKTVVVSEACEILRETLWKDGVFIFNDDEITHLRRINKEKIATIKQWFKSRC
jgi:hypothetical protein